MALPHSSVLRRQVNALLQHKAALYLKPRLTPTNAANQNRTGNTKTGVAAKAELTCRFDFEVAPVPTHDSLLMSTEAEQTSNNSSTQRPTSFYPIPTVVLGNTPNLRPNFEQKDGNARQCTTSEQTSMMKKKATKDRTKTTTEQDNERRQRSGNNERKTTKEGRETTKERRRRRNERRQRMNERRRRTNKDNEGTNEQRQRRNERRQRGNERRNE
mgnify:CR=1 FL=1